MAENDEIKTFRGTDGLPLSGITLKIVLRGHTDRIGRIAWSPDGRHLATPSDDGTIRIWNPDLTQEPIVLVNKQQINNRPSNVFCVGWSPDGEKLASGSRDNKICIWDVKTGKLLNQLQGHVDIVTSVNWSPDGQMLASTSDDRKIIIWSASKGTKLFSLEKHEDWVTSAAWSPNGKFLASGSGDTTIRVWDISNQEYLHALRGHFGRVTNLTWSPNGQKIVSASYDATIRIWDFETGREDLILEGHGSTVRSVSFSSNGRVLASNSWDTTVRLWRCNNWEMVGFFRENVSDNWAASLAFNPKKPILATLGNYDTVIYIWKFDINDILGNFPENSIRYTTAKIVLVGDSGVGKTGLGWRLAHNEFREHSSTHGQQFWVVPELKKTREDGTECEAVLWDLAGQPDYRLVHSLYLDDVDTALVLFDPTNRQEPLSGVDFWLNQLKHKDKKLRNSILVGARTDRGTSTLTIDELQAYCERNGITGGYIPTSAASGEGLSELIERLKTQIPWEQMTTTVTTTTFKRIKEFVISLKDEEVRNGILSSKSGEAQPGLLLAPNELRRHLEAMDNEWSFSDEEMMTAVGHLENHGYVTVLRGSNGELTILLTPNVLINLASSLVLEARRNPRGLGVLDENRLLQGEYPFRELDTLNQDEREILLDAVVVLFLEHNLCFRETFNNQTFLVFPSLINEKRPIDESIKIEEGASYRVKGAVENVYASLVVLLGYTNTFIRTHQWQNQAQYEMGEGEVCGFIQSDYRNGEIELVLYYGHKTPDPVRLTFRGLFERFLSRRELDISRYQPVTCHKCGDPLARNVVMDQLSKGKDFSFCHNCGEKLSLPNPEPVSRLSRREEVIMDIQQAVAQRRTAFEAALVRVKGLLRDQGREIAPSCFISYSWGVTEHERWVVQFAKDLRNAGIDVLLDRWHSPPGSDLGRYMDQIMKSDFVAVVGTPQLLKKYETQSADPVVAAELRLINVRLREPSVYGQTVIPLLLDGDVRSSFIPMLQTLVRVDFKQLAYYFRQLFDLIWRMYNLPFDNPLLEELQASMTPQDKL